MKLSDRLNDAKKPAKKAPERPADEPGERRSPARRGAGNGAAPAARPPQPSKAVEDKAGRAAARSGEWTDAKRRIHDLIVSELGPLLARSDTQIDLAAEVRSRLDVALDAVGVQATPAQRRKLVSEVTADILGYGPLEPLLADRGVTEVMVNGAHDVYVERNGRIERTDTRFTDEKHLRQVIDRIVAAVGRRVDEASPLCDARLPDGSRVNVVLPPLSLRGPALTIRKFPESPMLMSELVARGTLTGQLALFLQSCVQAKLNILVSGGTGTGKTTLLNAMSQYLPEHERIVTIEDAAELQLHQPHVLPLEARPANAEGQGLITIRDLVRNALRMRPDRIVVGEVRGAEALDMLQAMNTGHEGSLTTVHANTPRDALSRIETMVLMAGFDLTLRAIRDQIASAVDLIVQIDRLGDGRRVIGAVTEVQGMEGDVITLQDLFAYKFTSGGRESAASSGDIVPTGLRPRLLDKLKLAGVDAAPELFAPLPPARSTKGRR